MENQEIIEAVKRGEAEWSWVPVEFEQKLNGTPYKVTYQTMPDAMKLGSVRFSVTARTAQAIADLIGGALPTQKLEDRTYLACNHLLRPFTQIDGKITALSTDEKHSAMIDKALERLAAAGLPMGGIVATVGKSWVVCRALEHPDHLAYGDRTAANYGWHDPAAPAHGILPGLKLWQDLGTRHNDEHRDPSQTCRLVSRQVSIQEAGAEPRAMDMLELYQHPTLSFLVSHEGMLKVVRTPSVPVPPTQLIVLPPTTISG